MNITRRAALKGGTATVAAIAVTGAVTARAAVEDRAIKASEEFRAALASNVQLEKSYAVDDPDIERSGRYCGSDLAGARRAFSDAFMRLRTAEVSSTAGAAALLGCIGAIHAARDDWDEWAAPVYIAGYRGCPFFSLIWPEHLVVANAHEALNRLKGEG